jgi:hypothetical protein
VFHQAYLVAAGALPPPAVPLGNPAMPPTLANLLSDMRQQVTFGLSTIEIVSSQMSPSQVKEPKFTPLAFRSLVPFALIQIDAMGQKLAALPVQFPANSVASTQANLALNQAYNAILNAIAEYSLHPNLFVKPSDYYLNPNVTFTIDFDGTPAKTAAGFFVRGPGGNLIPGATLHPSLPAQ